MIQTFMDWAYEDCTILTAFNHKQKDITHERKLGAFWRTLIHNLPTYFNKYIHRILTKKPISDKYKILRCGPQSALYTYLNHL